MYDYEYYKADMEELTHLYLNTLVHGPGDEDAEGRHVRKSGR
jgi:hypothetical protein